MNNKNEIDELAAKILAEAEVSEEAFEDVPEIEEWTPKYRDELISRYDFFRKNIHEPGRVFYPCSGTDASPVKGFPNSEVVLMERIKGFEEIMHKNGIINAVQGDVLKHIPEKPYDLVIILNPQLGSKPLVRHLKQGGYVLSNDYHKNASELLEDTRFEGIGTIRYGKDKNLYLAEKDFSIFKKFPDYFGVFKRK